MTQTRFASLLRLARTSWEGIHLAAANGYARNTAADFEGLYR